MMMRPIPPRRARPSPKEIVMPATATLEIGQTAPDFKLKGPGGQFVSLSEYLGNKNVVLVFYPLAFSAVCSHQLPAIEKQRPKLEDLDATVLGVSIDSHFANEAFARQLGVGFSLLSAPSVITTPHTSGFRSRARLSSAIPSMRGTRSSAKIGRA